MKGAVVVAVVALLGLAQADKVIFKDCGSVDAKVNTVDVTPCPQEPCQFPRNTNISVTVNITTTKAYTKATNKVYGLIMGAKVPFPMDGDACKNMPCPAQAGQQISYNNKIFVKPEYPHVRLVVQWEVLDQDGHPIMCFDVPAQIVN